jgi:precorrin-6Y C5,15-methyltransferase (decarboxylating)
VPERIDVIGTAGPLAAADLAAVRGADLVVAGKRLLDELDPAPPRTAVIGGSIPEVLDAIGAQPGSVCVLASGDPGFFGVLRPIVERFGSAAVRVRPAPSSVALAFAAVAVPWDDATVVSAHGRPLAAAAALAAGAPKAAVLVSPDAPPEALGAALLAAGARHTRAVVCSQLGRPGERVVDTDLAGLAGGHFDPLSVVLLLGATAVAPRPSLAFGLPEAAYDHRDGMVTKAEVRAVALGKLDLPLAGVLWDVGAGSGSVAVEAARLAPGLEVVAVERDPTDAARIAVNAARHAVAVRVVEGHAPAAFAGLPDPDRVFVGGGGLEVLDAAIGRLRAGGTVVACYAAVDRAARAAERLGELVQVSTARGVRLPDGGLRLEANNPVFVVWGPPR